MPVKFECPCGKHLVAPESKIGKASKCPRCGERVVVPDPSSGAPTQPLGLDFADEEPEPATACAALPSPALPPPLPASSPASFPPPLPPTGGQTRSCPFCGEAIQAVAKKCKHCGEFLDGRPPARGGPAAAPRSRARVPSAIAKGDYFSTSETVSTIIAAFLCPGVATLCAFILVIVNLCTGKFRRAGIYAIVMVVSLVWAIFVTIATQGSRQRGF